MKGQIMATKSQSKYVKILNPSKKRAPTKRTLSLLGHVSRLNHDMYETMGVVDIYSANADLTKRRLERLQVTVDELVRDKNKLALDINDRFSEWVDFKAFSEAVMKDIKNLFHRSETNGRMLLDIEKRISPKVNPVHVDGKDVSEHAGKIRIVDRGFACRVPLKAEDNEPEWKPGPIIRKTEDSFDKNPEHYDKYRDIAESKPMIPFNDPNHYVIQCDRARVGTAVLDMLRGCFPNSMIALVRGIDGPPIRIMCAR